jgi:hypothetical protein
MAVFRTESPSLPKQPLFETSPSFEYSARLNHPVFATIYFYRARSSDLRPTPNLEDQVPVFISPSDRFVQLYPQAPGSLFAAFYDSQDYRGSILTHLHRGDFGLNILNNYFIRNYVFNN